MIKPEVITFRKDDQVAFICTDGVNNRTYEPEYGRSHDTLRKAMAYLESRGWSIDNLNITVVI